MTSDARKKMLDRIRAMMNTEGRTEAEMMAFLAKARELMATYEIDEKDLAEHDRESTTYHKTVINDPYGIKETIYTAVGNFCRCKGVNGRKKNYGIAFAGLESDVIFATWLLDTLQRFVMRELRNFQKEKIAKGARYSNNLTSSSFVHGCSERIREKLKELTPKIEAKNKELIMAELKKNGVVLHSYTINAGQLDPNSANAGRKAGNAARFDRPVSAGGVRYLK